MSAICIDCRYIGPRHSGIGEMIRGLIELMPAMAPDLHFLLLRNPAHADALTHGDNVAEIAVPHPANGPATMWFLPQVVDLTGVALFHAPANIMPAGLPVPCVTTVHDIMWLTEPSLCRRGAKGVIDRLFYGHGITRALRSAQAILTVSAATAAAVARHYPPAASRVHVTPSGVARRYRRVTPDRGALATLGLSPQRRFVLTVGQNAPYKNHEGAVRGFAAAFADCADLDLVIVHRSGGTPRRLRALARQLGLAERVHVLPGLPEAVMLSLYAAAEALLHPSFSEGFGHPVAEALACGCPVVTSDRSAMPEVAGGAAQLIDPYDAGSIARGLRVVVDDPARAGAMRAAGLVRAGELSWNKAASATLNVYRHLLERQG